MISTGVLTYLDKGVVLELRGIKVISGTHGGWHTYGGNQYKRGKDETSFKKPETW